MRRFLACGSSAAMSMVPSLSRRFPEGAARSGTRSNSTKGDGVPAPSSSATIGGGGDEGIPPPSSAAGGDDFTERSKDQAALKKYVLGLAFGAVCGITLWFGSASAKKRYFGDEGSTRVSVETRGKPSLGGPFVLVDTNGNVVTQADFLGSWTFFYFGFTHCPEICPVELNRMSKVVDAVRAGKPNQSIKPLFVSCDPRRDSLHAIREYLAVFHPDFVGLVGTPKQVNDACKSYRIYYSVPSDSVVETDDYLIDHSIAIFLFDPKGQFVDFFGNRYDEREITERVLKYMDHYEKDATWTNW